MTAKRSWKYQLGLLLILTVTLIWVASAEVTQLIYERYRHPFLLTWLGASLLAVYLPISYLREALAPCFAQVASYFSKPSHRSDKNPSPAASGSSNSSLKKAVSPRHALKEVELGVREGDGDKGSGDEAEEDEESASLIAKVGAAAAAVGGGGGEGRHSHAHGHGHSHNATELSGTREIIRVASMLAPMWLLTEYLSNASLSMTSVASTTILSSTSALFTLLFGVTMGEDSLSAAKVIAVLVSIAGVVMTELGKSTAADDNEVFGDSSRNPGETAGDAVLPSMHLIGDLFGLASAVSYGFYTTLLKKYVCGPDGEEKADMQKVYGYIGLFTMFGLWWLVFPLHLLGWEPSISLPSSVNLDEDIVANSLVGSVVSDYFWALSVVWTTPLIATLGLSLTIPLAMVADMVMHQRQYSAVYVLGSLGVFAGFLIANLNDRTPQTSSTKDREGASTNDKVLH